MSQLTRLVRNEDAISRKADVVIEAPDLTPLDDLASDCCLYQDPLKTISFVQHCLHRLWKQQARDPSQRCKPFARWYMRLDIPREPDEMYPWLLKFAEIHKLQMTQ